MRSLYLLLAVLVGVGLGVGVYTFWYARGYSYLTNDPRACANCHVMREYYDAWVKSTHHQAAVCNDCHAPHNFAGKYFTKAVNGYLHSFAFTSGRFPDNILITGRNERVTEGACRSCHGEITSAMTATHARGDVACIRCHFDVGHSAASFSPASARGEFPSVEANADRMPPEDQAHAAKP